VLLHVIDASRADLDEVEKAVAAVLGGLGIEGKKTLLVFNKADALGLEARKRLSTRGGLTAVVSAKTGEGVDELTRRLALIVGLPVTQKQFFIPKDSYALIGEFYALTQVIARLDEEAGCRLTVRLGPSAERVLSAKLASTNT
jgi:GTPase